MRWTRARRTAAGATLTLAVAAGAVPALAATKNGITPRKPKAGATIKAGTAPTFKGRVRGKGSVWIYICDKRKRNGKGLICDDWVIRAKKKGKRFVAKARVYDYPSFWLNSPGTYYWQAHRIHCTGKARDCSREGPISKLRVK